MDPRTPDHRHSSGEWRPGAEHRVARPRPLRRLILGALLAVALAAAACGDDDSSTPPDAADTTATAAAPTTTAAATITAAPTTTAATVPAGITADDLRERGPFQVGVTTRTLPSGNLVEVYYPATDTAAGMTDTYRVRDYLPAAIAGLMPPDIDDGFTVAAARDSEPSPDGPFPLVLFSHGSASFRQQWTALLSHLASWGMVAAAPDHPARNLTSRLGGGPGDVPDSAADLRATRALLTDGVADDPLLTGLVDPALVALAGHSAGGDTVGQVAADEGIAGYVAYASGVADDTPDPSIPSVFMAGALDSLVEPTRTRSDFDAAPPPSTLIVLDESGHLVFSDFCAVGGGDATLVDLAEAAGIGDLVPDELRALATDGCEPPNRPVEEVWPAIFQATTGFYRWVFGVDADPVGLAPTDLAEFGATVETSG